MACLLAIGMIFVGALPSQADLAFRNVRPTLGLLGPERREKDLFMPGDLIYYAFDLANLQATTDGLYRYAMTVEILDGKNTVIFPKEPAKPRESQAFCPLGGDVLPTFAYTETDTDMVPGNYTMQLQCVDRVSGRKGRLVKAFTIADRQFSILRMAMLYSTSGETAPPFGAPGQSFLLTFVASQFVVDPKTEACDVDLTIQILDNTGKQLGTKPFRGQITNPEDASRRLHSIRFAFQPNKAGQYTLEVIATDKKAEGKPTVKTAYPFQVISPR